MYVHHVRSEAGGKLKRGVFYHGIFLLQRVNANKCNEASCEVVTVKLSWLTDRMNELGPKDAGSQIQDR